MPCTFGFDSSPFGLCCGEATVEGAGDATVLPGESSPLAPTPAVGAGDLTSGSSPAAVFS